VINSTLEASSNLHGVEIASGRGIQCTYCTEVFIKNSSFTNLTGSNGGAIQLINSQQGYLEGNNFKNNNAKVGGAIYV